MADNRQPRVNDYVLMAQEPFHIGIVRKAGEHKVFVLWLSDDSDDSASSGEVMVRPRQKRWEDPKLLLVLPVQTSTRQSEALGLLQEELDERIKAGDPEESVRAAIEASERMRSLIFDMKMRRRFVEELRR